jgi:lysozyme family protein
LNVFDYAFETVMAWEDSGEAHKDAQDPGGLTVYGLAQRYHSEVFEKGLPTEAQAKEIYRHQYWEKIRCDKMNPALGLICFDCCVNQGASRAAKFLQESVTDQIPGLVIDGRIGPRTLAAAGNVDKDSLVRDFTTRRILHYQSLPHFVKFGRGWLRRSIDLAQKATLFGT